MTKERLRSLPMDELQRIADRYGVDFEADIDREALISLMLDTLEELELERERSHNYQVKVEAKKYQGSEEEEEDLPGDLAPIPDGYNETRLVVMARDPSWAFAYWEIKEEKMRQLERDPDRVRLILRVHDVTEVQFNGKNSHSSFDIPLKLTDNRWYINVPGPGRGYVMELIVKKKNKEIVLARSNHIMTPREGFAFGHESLQKGELNGRAILAMSLHPTMFDIPGSGTIPQRILTMGS